MPLDEALTMEKIARKADLGVVGAEGSLLVKDALPGVKTYEPFALGSEGQQLAIVGGQLAWVSPGAASTRHVGLGGGYYYFGAVGGGHLSSTQTGTLKITLPFGPEAGVSSHRSMVRISIKGSSYSSKEGWELILTGYLYDDGVSNSWHSSMEGKLFGHAPFSQVRFGKTASNYVILLGDLTTEWSYANVWITDLIVGYAYMADWHDADWTIDVIQSEGGITIDQTRLEDTMREIIAQNRYGARTGVWSGEVAVFALSKESYPTHGFFYNQASPDMWRFKWAGAQVFGINAEDGAITGGAAGGALKVQTSYGYFQMGPLNASYCHLYTDAPAVIFNKEIQVMGGVIPYTDSAYNFGSPTKQINNIYYDGQLWQGINASILGHIYTINVTTTWAGLPYSAFHPAGGTFILTASRSGYPRRGTIAVVVKEGAAGNHLLSTSFSDGGLNVLASGACEFRSYNGALQFQAATGAYEGNYTIRWIRLN